MGIKVTWAMPAAARAASKILYGMASPPKPKLGRRKRSSRAAKSKGPGRGT